MIAGGTVTVYVSDMERALEFYLQTLGLALAYRGGPGFAMVDAGKGLRLGLHTPHPGAPTPGARGALSIGFDLTEPLDDVVTRLEGRGVTFSGPPRGDGPVRLAFFADPDGNPLYLCEARS